MPPVVLRLKPFLFFLLDYRLCHVWHVTRLCRLLSVRFFTENQILECGARPHSSLRGILSHFVSVSFSWLLMGLILTVIIFSCLAVASCHFLKYIDGNGNNGAVCLYRYYDTSDSQCVYHPEEVQYNELENVAHMGAIVAPMAAIFCLFIVVVEYCCCRFICSRLLMGLGLVCAQIMQGITFLLFDSEQFWCMCKTCVVMVYSVLLVSLVTKTVPVIL